MDIDGTIVDETHRSRTNVQQHATTCATHHDARRAGA
jgi:hypothetical protein